RSGCEWLPVPNCDGFRDETRGFTRPGRVVIPARVFPRDLAVADPQQKQALQALTERDIGAVPAPHFYLRCRLSQGLPDAPPVLRGVFADAVLVEQWDQSETGVAPLPRGPGSTLRLQELRLDKTIEADIGDAATDLADHGWGPAAAAWGVWPLSNHTWQ